MSNTDDLATLDRPKRRHEPIVGPAPHSPEWYAAHGPGQIFTASEAADLCGMGKIQPLEVWRRHAGLAPPVETTDRMLAGLDAEDFICRQYERKVGIPVSRPLPMFFHPTIPFLGATPDAERADGRLVQFKATSFLTARDLGEEGSDWVPDSWLFQCQQEMLVMGDEIEDLVAQLDLFTQRVYTIEFNQTIADGIVAAAVEMRERLANNDPPPLEWTHPRAKQLVKELYGVEADLKVALDCDDAVAWAKRQRCKNNVKRWEALADAYEARVLDRMGNAACGVLPGGSREVARIFVKESTYQVTRRAHVRVQERKCK